MAERERDIISVDSAQAAEQCTYGIGMMALLAMQA
jgi:hypothetical protein